MRPPTSRWLAAVAATFMAAALAACGSSDPASPTPAKPPASSEGPVPTAPAPPGDKAPGSDKASSPFSPKSFCEGYSAAMGILLQGGAPATQVLPGFLVMLVTAPDEFRGWAGDMAPWVQAQIDDDSAAISEHAPASEEAGYQISNKCQFVLAEES